MVKFTSKSDVTQACMNSIHYNNLQNKISNKSYAKVVRTIDSGFKNGSIESVWKSFKKHKQHVNRNEYVQLKKDVKEFYYNNTPKQHSFIDLFFSRTSNITKGVIHTF